MMHFDFRNHPRQERGIDPTLRRLIDEAVAAGRVKVIPRGVSGIGTARWDGEKNQLVAADSRTEKQKAADKRRARNAQRVYRMAGSVK